MKQKDKKATGKSRVDGASTEALRSDKEQLIFTTTTASAWRCLLACSALKATVRSVIWCLLVRTSISRSSLRRIAILDYFRVAGRTYLRLQSILTTVRRRRITLNTKVKHSWEVKARQVLYMTLTQHWVWLICHLLKKDIRNHLSLGLRKPSMKVGISLVKRAWLRGSSASNNNTSVIKLLIYRATYIGNSPISSA